MAWAKLGSVTLGSAGDNLSSGTISANTFLSTIAYLEDNGSAINGILNFNNDTGTNYARRRSANGGTDSTSTSTQYPELYSYGAAHPFFSRIFIINISSEEKLVIVHSVGQNTAGASNAPNRWDAVMKWANTSDQITEIDIDNTEAGSYDTDSNISVIGSD